MNDSHSWNIYIVRCADNTLYTGITKDVPRRIAEHNSKKSGAKYTRYRQPVTLIYLEEADSRSTAMKRELQIKKMPLNKKMVMIGGT